MPPFSGEQFVALFERYDLLIRPAQLVAYIIIGTLVGHDWPRAPMFGVAPCRTTIFIRGVLILARRIVSPWLRCHPGCVGL